MHYPYLHISVLAAVPGRWARRCLAQLTARVQGLDRRLEAARSLVDPTERDAVLAFVVFDTVEDKQLALEAYAERPKPEHTWRLRQCTMVEMPALPAASD